MPPTTYPKRLIEVDLPIARISAHARREKSIRHGYISTLHIWWARRPLAACRAVICAALWPDPADANCPQAFRDAAARLINDFARRADGDMKLLTTSSEESKHRWATIAKEEGGRMKAEENAGSSFILPPSSLRAALLDFIADFANWDNSTVPAYLETSRALTQAAHEALGGEPGTRPLVVDPFAGGGSIPLEALRVGADAFASDLNPVAVLLNKVVLEYIPKYGQQLADEVRKWGKWINEHAEKELAEFYPKDQHGHTPVAYLWARTIQCEGPGCGAEVPLIRSLWLANKGRRKVALRLVSHPRAKRVDFEIIEGVNGRDVGNGTIQRGSATCPVCGYTTPVVSLRQQLRERHGGAADARMFCVVLSRPGEHGHLYREPNERDIEAVHAAGRELKRRKKGHEGPLSLIPDERICLNEIRRISVPIYGMVGWSDLFTPRQAFVISSILGLVRDAGVSLAAECGNELAGAVQTCLALAVDKCADYWNTIATWMPRGTVGHGFARQAIPMTWDFVEANPIADFHCAWHEAFAWVAAVCDSEAKSGSRLGRAEVASATANPLPDDSAHALLTDPPYYDAVPYSHLSDFFYVWLHRGLGAVHPALFSQSLVAKDQEIVVDRPHELSNSKHDIVFYEAELTKAFADSRRVVRPDGIGVIVFASKSTASWEAILKAVVEAGWTITGSWPVDTEREARMAAQGQARLASSVHLVCRPRESRDGVVQNDAGEWRDVLTELPRRIHEWMPRLAEEGVVGADAIFACLGPALEIFSRYSRVEKANGEVATLREYLEHVWAAVSTEALSMIFRDADAAGLEPDARLTAMWLWTLGGRMKDEGGRRKDEEEEDEGEAAEESGSFRLHPSAFILEFDAARKIAQGLGIHLEKSESIVAVKGETARLLPVAERTQYLFGKDASAGTTGMGKGKKKAKQKTLFGELGETAAAEAGWAELKGPPPGTTVLDRLHQAMILFAAGRGELMKRFLVDDGVGSDSRFWKLAQSLSALYPSGTDEKRWVDGVLARKKGLGL
jgi:adenine-specific DNA methylase